ncbi:cyclin-like protein [Cladochytrium replicatum]|nr:cyclin-like protein [Cladochytrium replicatum]
MSSTDYIDHAGFAPSEGTEQMKDVRNSPATAALESSHPDLGQKHPLVPINDKPNIIKKDSPTSMKVPQKIILPSPSQSRKRPRSETPSEIMQSLEQRLKKFKTLSSSDADQWIFSTEELLFTPSFVHLGKKYYDEVFERARGCDFMRKCARDLGLPTETLCMAKMLFHRFYMRKPMTQTKDYIYWHIAATSLFIAVKSNDTYRKLDAIIPVVIKYSSKKENVTPRDKEWIVWKDIILSTEDVILMSVCFDLTMEFPHAYAVDLVWQYSEIVPASVLDKLAIQAYHYSTDWFVSTFPLHIGCLIISKYTA